MNVSVVGAAAILDYIFPVEKLPAPGEVALILREEGMDKPFWGGCAPNIAAGLTRLGLQVALVYPVGDDFSGSDCERYWHSLNIDLSNLCTQHGLPSGRAYLFFQPYGETMCFSALGAAASAKPREDVRLAEMVVITPVCGEFTLFYLNQALKQNCQIAISGVVSPQIANGLDDIQIMLLNSREAKALCELAEVAEITQLSSRYPHCCFFITDGDKGSEVYLDQTRIPIPVIQPEKYADPTGAGDAYTAGVIMAWLKGYDPETAGFIGATCASFVIEAFGAQTNLPDFDMVKERLILQAPEIGRKLQ
jgi:sugar/nucleoside kinase (ribokinase family)